MATLKKNQVNQILFTMVDATDFATVEDSLTTFVVKRFGVNHGSAAANVSTLSRAPSKVGSGLYRLSVEATACNYDYMALKITATGAAAQILVYEMATYDDTDQQSLITAHISDFQSRVPKEVSTKSGLTAVQSDFQSRVPKEVANASQLLLIKSNLSDVESAVDDVYSLLGSRVTKEVANASQLLLVKSLASDAHSAAAQANSRALVIESTLSDIDSALTSQFSDFQSRVPKEVANASQLLLMKSNLSDVESGVDDVYSLLTAVQSDFQSRVPKEVATKSGLTAVQSDFQSRVPKEVANASQLLLIKSNLSDVESGVDDIYSLLGSRVTKEVANASQLLLMKSTLSDVESGVTEARKILRNKMHIDSATGAVHLYDDDDSIMLSGAVTADGDSTLRTRLA